jgi:hypothetical protein
MDEPIGEELDLDLTSAPVDPANPSFDSFLSALQAFHEGKVGADVLKKYHSVLTAQVAKSESDIGRMKVSSDDEDFKNLSLGSLTLLRETLDRLHDYVSAPGPQTLAICIESFLRSRGAVAFLDKKLQEAK